MIVRRFLSIFYPPAEYQTVKLVVAAGGEKLYTSAKQLKVQAIWRLQAFRRRRRSGMRRRRTERNRHKAVMLRLRGRKRRTPGFSVCRQASKGEYFLRMAMPSARERPPRRSATRLDRWCSPWRMPDRLIEEEELREQIKGSGIGTSATRAEIIKKLVRVGYLNLNKRRRFSRRSGWGNDL